MRTLLVLSSLLVLACGPKSSTSGGAGDMTTVGNHGDMTAATLGALTISPAATNVRLKPGATLTITFVTQAIDSLGATSNVTATLTTTGATLGTFSGNTFTWDGKSVGTTNLTATYQTASALATITIALNDLLVTQDGLDEALADTVAAAADNAALVPTWIYPDAQTLLPPNVYDVQLTFTPTGGSEAYLTVLENASGRVRLLSKQPHLLLDHPSWDQAMTILGPGPFTATAAAFKTADPTSAGRAIRTFRASQKSLDGALYYWAAANGYQQPYGTSADDTGNLRGYFRYDFTDPNHGADASLFLGFSRAGNECVGCHSLSKDGTKLATSFDGDSYWGLVDVASNANPVAYEIGGQSVAGAVGDFSTFTPDGKYLLTTNHDFVRAFDVSVPGVINEVAHFDDSANTVTTAQIAISPLDGKTVVLVEDMGNGNATRVQNGRIVQLTWDASVPGFSSRIVLAEDSTMAHHYYYPAISPDGAWLIFNRGDAGTTSYENLTGELYAMRLGVSGAQPFLLTTANQGANLTNSWPRWAPFAADDGEGHTRFYFTFSSTRQYIGTGTRTQLWLASFDANAAEGTDPTGPAFWLPMQNFATGNHAAQWTEIFVPPIN